MLNLGILLFFFVQIKAVNDSNSGIISKLFGRRKPKNNQQQGVASVVPNYVPNSPEPRDPKPLEEQVVNYGSPVPENTTKPSGKTNETEQRSLTPTPIKPSLPVQTQRSLTPSLSSASLFENKENQVQLKKLYPSGRRTVVNFDDLKNAEELSENPILAPAKSSTPTSVSVSNAGSFCSNADLYSFPTSQNLTLGEDYENVLRLIDLTEKKKDFFSIFLKNILRPDFKKEEESEIFNRISDLTGQELLQTIKSIQEFEKEKLNEKEKEICLLFKNACKIAYFSTQADENGDLRPNKSVMNEMTIELCNHMRDIDEIDMDKYFDINDVFENYLSYHEFVCNLSKYGDVEEKAFFKVFENNIRNLLMLKKKKEKTEKIVLAKETKDIVSNVQTISRKIKELIGIMKKTNNIDILTASDIEITEKINELKALRNVNERACFIKQMIEREISEAIIFRPNTRKTYSMSKFFKQYFANYEQIEFLLNQEAQARNELQKEEKNELSEIIKQKKQIEVLNQETQARNGLQKEEESELNKIAEQMKNKSEQIAVLNQEAQARNELKKEEESELNKIAEQMAILTEETQAREALKNESESELNQIAQKMKLEKDQLKEIKNQAQKTENARKIEEELAKQAKKLADAKNLKRIICAVAFFAPTFVFGVAFALKKHKIVVKIIAWFRKILIKNNIKPFYVKIFAAVLYIVYGAALLHICK